MKHLVRPAPTRRPRALEADAGKPRAVRVFIQHQQRPLAIWPVNRVGGEAAIVSRARDARAVEAMHPVRRAKPLLPHEPRAVVSGKPPLDFAVLPFLESHEVSPGVASGAFLDGAGRLDAVEIEGLDAGHQILRGDLGIEQCRGHLDLPLPGERRVAEFGDDPGNAVRHAVVPQALQGLADKFGMLLELGGGRGLAEVVEGIPFEGEEAEIAAAPLLLHVSHEALHPRRAPRFVRYGVPAVVLGLEARPAHG